MTASSPEPRRTNRHRDVALHHHTLVAALGVTEEQIEGLADALEIEFSISVAEVERERWHAADCPLFIARPQS